MKKSISIVGSGVVGRATGKVLAAKGFSVVFVDIDPVVVEQLRREGYDALEVEQVEAPGADVFMLSVPTYPLERRDDGIDYIVSAAASVGGWLSRADGYRLVVVRSAVLPGTTEEIIVPVLEQYSGKRAGNDFGVCVNPEYLRERTAEEDFADPWITVIGELDTVSGDLLAQVYSWVDCPVHRVSLREAEMQKFAHNLCNASKISFFNEMRLVCRRVGLDSEKILPVVVRSAEALWNPDYGTRDLGPFGGSCLPKDVNAFLSWARRQRLRTPIMDAVLEVNESLPRSAAPVLE